MIKRARKGKSIAGLLIGVAIIGYCLRYALNILFANNVIPSIYGDLCLGLQLLNLTTTIMLLGSNSSATQFLSLYNKEKQYDNAHSFIHWNLNLLFKSIIFSIVIISILFFVTLVLHWYHFRKMGEVHVAVYFLLISPCAALISLFLSYIVGMKHALLAAFIRKIIKYILLLVTFLAIVYLFNPAIKPIHLMLIYLFVYLILMFASIIVYKAISFVPLNFSKLRTENKSENQTEWFKASLDIGKSNLLTLLSSYLGLLILEAMSPLLVVSYSEHEVGFYAACQVIVGFILLIPNNIYSSLVPQILSINNANKGYTKLNRHIKRASIVGILVGGVLFTVIVIFSDRLLLHFGASYINARPALIILAISAFIVVIKGMSPSLLIYSFHIQTYLRIMVISIVIIVIFGVVLTYFYGMLGAAISSLLASIYQTCNLVYFAKKKTKFKPLGFF